VWHNPVAPSVSYANSSPTQTGEGDKNQALLFHQLDGGGAGAQRGGGASGSRLL
jgi:hypothetical protein